MGIVMAVFMLVGFLLLLPWTSLRLRAKPGVFRAAGTALLIAGMWNALWYGLRHLTEFWGQAALVSGILMMAAAIIVLTKRSAVTASASASGTVKPLSWLIAVALLACFLLYAITLVRLNLGLPIIGY